MKSIRSGKGLGDSVYLQSVVRHLIKNGERFKVATDWPDVFLPIADKIELIPFARTGIDIAAHYVSRKGFTETTTFRDCCISASIKGVVELKIDWPVATGELIDTLKKACKPIVIVQMPRAPMGREDGFGIELLPDCRRIQQILNILKSHVNIVQVGSGDALYRFSGIDIDLSNKTTVKELIDVCSTASGFIGYCSFILPIAESFQKPCIMVWSRKGLQSNDLFIRRVTPRKMIEQNTTGFIIDDCGDYEMEDMLEKFKRQIGLWT